ncbi:MAG: hypothetical protein MK078_04430 [Crocinitomicaceae bacterium]|nr:hypothetical protein [Crocinitomicaceae bacterium]
MKNLLKKYFYKLKIRERFSPTVQIQQRQLYLNYLEQKDAGKTPKLKDTGFRVFSQFEEDGLLLFVLTILGMPNKTFLEIGADDGVNSNCANFYFNFGYHGLFIDGNETAIERGKRFYSKNPHPWMYQPEFLCSKVTAENINDLVSSKGFSGDIDLMSIDIDGNDYYVWKALKTVKPLVVIIETHIEFGYNDIVVPYDANYIYPGKHPDYHGASPVAMVKLAKHKGYRLVGANQRGFNLIFVREGMAEKELPEVTVESILQHPSAIKAQERFEAIKDWEYETHNY